MNSLFPLLSGITLVVGGSLLIAYSLYTQWQSSLLLADAPSELVDKFRDL